MKENREFTQQEIEQAQQWIADNYHCSDCWGCKTKYSWMKEELKEAEIGKFPSDYSPPVEMYRICADYWNELCDRYPN